MLFNGMMPDYNGDGISDETDAWIFSSIMIDVVDNLPMKKKNNKKQKIRPQNSGLFYLYQIFTPKLSVI